jgi:hypothetical protein
VDVIKGEGDRLLPNPFAADALVAGVIKVKAPLSAAKGLAQYVIAISLGFALYSISYGPWLNP